MSLEDEILDVLSFNQWKAGRDIRSEICNRRNIDPLAPFGAPSYGSVYTKLREMHDKGWVEQRDSRDKDGLVREYKLLDGGLRRKNRKPGVRGWLLRLFQPHRA